MILLLLFNVLGYYGVFLGLKYRNTQAITQKLDTENYRESETITLKVPLALPYHVDENEYERVNGEIEHNGEFYRLVKQKLANDTLYIVCIKDHQSKQIKNALADYVKTFTDRPAESRHQSKTVPSFIKDFLPSEIAIESNIAGWNNNLSFITWEKSFTTLSLPVFSPPPQS
jgi:hypothetical protein